MVALLCVALVLAMASFGYGSAEPVLDDAPVTVTADAGRVATLPCPLMSKGRYRVVWKDPSSTWLTFDSKVLVEDSRLSIHQTQPSQWDLRIDWVRQSDQGTYTCVVNTHPMMTKTVSLVVAG
ncbi:cell adhesion molecule 3-like [Haliotis asinina]|uniref:cell adhesion molecule 3-like n=1 Tax=Haliotis asinina TaxID=109174 RepID=UPI003531B916